MNIATDRLRYPDRWDHLRSLQEMLEQAKEKSLSARTQQQQDREPYVRDDEKISTRDPEQELTQETNSERLLDAASYNNIIYKMWEQRSNVEILYAAEDSVPAAATPYVPLLSTASASAIPVSLPMAVSAALENPLETQLYFHVLHANALRSNCSNSNETMMWRGFKSMSSTAFKTHIIRKTLEANSRVPW